VPALTYNQERKYFDSGDYALSKAGKASDTGVTTIGTEHPKAEEIPHTSPLMHTLSRNDSISSSTGSAGLASSPDGQTMLPPGPAGMHRGSINGIPGGGFPGVLSSRSPVKESSFLARSASIDEANMAKDEPGDNSLVEGSVSPPAKREGIPIRR
jgi:hypothetical protein